MFVVYPRALENNGLFDVGSTRRELLLRGVYELRESQSDALDSESVEASSLQALVVTARSSPGRSLPTQTVPYPKAALQASIDKRLLVWILRAPKLQM